MSGEKLVNINQIAPWLISATNNNKNFLLKHGDLRILYLLVLWDYVSKQKNIVKISKDEQITIRESDLVKMVQLIFDNSYYPYFERVCNF